MIRIANYDLTDPERTLLEEKTDTTETNIKRQVTDDLRKRIMIYTDNEGGVALLNEKSTSNIHLHSWSFESLRTPPRQCTINREYLTVIAVCGH